MAETTDFSFSAANIRYNATNQKAYLEALASQLQSSLPGMITVNRNFSLLPKNRTIKDIMIVLDDHEYRLNYSKSLGIQTYIGNRVRGVVLKTEMISFQQWLQSLAHQVAKHAALHSSTSESLEQFLLGKQQ